MIGCCKRSFKTTATATTSETTATHEGKTIEILLSIKTVSFNLVSNEDSSQQIPETNGPGWSFSYNKWKFPWLRQLRQIYCGKNVA